MGENWYDNLDKIPTKPSKRERILRVAHGMTIEQSAKVSELIDDILMPKIQRISIFGETEADYNEYLKEYELELERYERWSRLPKLIRKKIRAKIRYPDRVAYHNGARNGELHASVCIRTTRTRIENLKLSLEVAEVELEMDKMYLRSLQKGE